ncbi:hypothetical protein D1AOALGA4SA_5109 [Olavius algarvensis Delta 1 endosymbiont]|nr:hypothetical protein D1AOALGA4SA_5109 [Olavius algarvensis Delta 1 endosymbiont]
MKVVCKLDLVVNKFPMANKLELLNMKLLIDQERIDFLF